jgi:DNA-binding NarL/FixJ family response regulator
MPEPARRTRIFLIDDHALFRESISRLLAREPGLEVVGDCATIEQSLALLRRRPVDLVLLDYDLGEANGAQFMRLARQEHLAAKILIVTAGIRPDQAADLIRQGVAGIFLKRDSAASLAESIRDIMTGKVSFDQHLFQQAMEGVQPSSASNGPEGLTKRERQVLAGVFEGFANKEIAATLGVSESSIKATLQQLFTKTGVRTRSQLVRVALERWKGEV